MELNKKINVLFISSWYPNRVKPTLGNFIQKHAEAASIYANVTVLHVCFDDNLSDKNLEIVSTEINSIKTSYIYCKKSSNLLIRFYRYLKAYNKGFKIIKQQNYPDIIHSNIVFPVGLVFCFLSSFKKIPFVISENWTGYHPETNTKIGLIQKYFLKRIAKKSSMLLPVSVDLENAMIAVGLKGNYKVIPNVVDTSLFSINKEKNSSEKKILHVSSFVDEHKNISGILRVIKKLSEIRQDFTMHFISDGDKAPFIIEAEKMNLLNKFVFFYGEKSTNEVAQMMHQSDFLLMFSNYENLPCVIVEAYAAGLPVVSSDVGGIAEIVSDNNGMLVKSKDEKALLSAIDKMLDKCRTYDKNVIHKFAEDNFSYESVGKKFMEVYLSILNK